jgi:hypothetical protein
MEALRTSETSVYFKETTRRYTPGICNFIILISYTHTSVEWLVYLLRIAEVQGSYFGPNTTYLDRYFMDIFCLDRH